MNVHFIATDHSVLSYDLETSRGLSLVPDSSTPLDAATEHFNVPEHSVLSPKQSTSDSSGTGLEISTLTPLSAAQKRLTLSPFSEFGSETLNEWFSFEVGAHEFSLRAEQVEDDVRFLCESADSLSGCIVNTTMTDAWGGFASSLVDLVRDEHPKLDIVVAPAGIHQERRKSIPRFNKGQFNIVQTLVRLNESASLISPIHMDSPRLPVRFHLNSFYKELIDVPHFETVTNQVNWRQFTKFADIVGQAPLAAGEWPALETCTDLSFPSQKVTSGQVWSELYLIRGFSNDALSDMFDDLDLMTELKAPECVWVCTEDGLNYESESKQSASSLRASINPSRSLTRVSTGHRSLSWMHALLPFAGIGRDYVQDVFWAQECRECFHRIVEEYS